MGKRTIAGNRYASFWNPGITVKHRAYLLRLHSQTESSLLTNYVGQQFNNILYSFGWMTTKSTADCLPQMLKDAISANAYCFKALLLMCTDFHAHPHTHLLKSCLHCLHCSFQHRTGKAQCLCMVLIVNSICTRYVRPFDLDQELRNVWNMTRSLALKRNWSMMTQ